MTDDNGEAEKSSEGAMTIEGLTTTTHISLTTTYILIGHIINDSDQTITANKMDVHPINGESMVTSPKGEKMVGICKNCSYSFRVANSELDSFCSKGNDWNVITMQ